MKRISAEPSGVGYYHCVSRVVDKRLVFSGAEKEVFRSIMRKLETFCDVRVATYCLMGNHFHLLVEVPPKGSLPPLTPATLLERLALLYDRATVATVAEELERADKSGNEVWKRSIFARYEHRRGDLSIFLKELKQRISIFMNDRLGRVGTLWEGRFRSTLIEGGEKALITVAAYIDLNPVRAGLVARPEDYRWSGYGEAMGGGRGSARARQGLGSIQREGLENPGSACPWKETMERYRCLLYTDGAEIAGDESAGAPGRRGVTPEEAVRVVESGGRVSLPELLRCRVRYFSDGAVFGSSAFVEETFVRLHELGRLSPNRETGARRMRGGEWGDLRVLRDLRIRVVENPRS